MSDRHMPPALRFLLAARRSELLGLEALAVTCELVVHVSALVHALQKERGYSNFYLCNDGDRFQPTLAGFTQDAVTVEVSFGEFLHGLQTPSGSGNSRARLLNCIAHALFRLDDLKALRQNVRDRCISVEQAEVHFTQIIAGLLAIVFEAADSALDPGVTRILVSLLNFMQGKELSGQERACGVLGFTTGYFSDDLKARMLGLEAAQTRSFNTFARYADTDTLALWEAILQKSDQVSLMRVMAQRTTSDQRVDTGLAEMWFELCTVRIDAMRVIERQLADNLAQRCVTRIAQTRQELDDHRLLLSRYADHAGGRTPNVVFSVQSRIVDVPPEDGVSDEMTRPILDMMHEQTIRLREADAALAELRGALDEKKQIDRAKAILVSRYGKTEQAAHELLQKASMNGGVSVAEVARQVVEGGVFPK